MQTSSYNVERAKVTDTWGLSDINSDTPRRKGMLQLYDKINR